MSKDLEETLNELGPDYRAVVARLRKAKGGEDFRRKTIDVRGHKTRDGRRGGRPQVLRLPSNVLRPTLAAASLLVLIGLGVIFLRSEDLRLETRDLSFGAHEYRATVAEMIATQNPDGSWQNDFLTRRNAEALKVCGDPVARIAYKKAVRNLRSRGML